ncbi:dTDP-4-amino-4,6-dideoxygalactose transaminase [Microvirga lenta]|uniref:dTDP-4-amino-4,6-dideoxygalactose transaminase n=1 Tax=Microvirga lenta TaxID=2881337 RepID=UPI001D00071F|nr:dTDP-4-amino-4,6-dideoxygalactose transaminase [Microvirga lenta]MCB5175195.1 dTDP-4-amino-4,6-dideoxygalactose transaminase [Microvirga lenta]
MDRIPFNVPALAGRELENIREALEKKFHISGNGPFTRLCQEYLERYLGGGQVLLTHSCTAALEMSAILAEIGPGDEVIMPSYTFTSTANAFVLRGATPVFIDIRPDTLNLDETLVEQAITPRTKAICVVHYAGVAAEMDVIMAIAERHGLTVIEDAAQGIYGSWRDRPLGSIGQMAAFSFHETKNIISGEGGALIVNDPALFERAEIVWEKGTNRAQFQRGEIARYTWVDVGSSFLPSELIAAFLHSQLENGPEITQRRVAAWNYYYDAFASMEETGSLKRPVVPQSCTHNGHIFYLTMRDAEQRDKVLKTLQSTGIHAIIHYVPLHSAPAGLRYGRCGSNMTHTDSISSRLVRLPMHARLDRATQDRVIEAIRSVLT